MIIRTEVEFTWMSCFKYSYRQLNLKIKTMIKIYVIWLQKNWAKIFTTITKNPVTLCLAGMESVKKGPIMWKKFVAHNFFLEDGCSRSKASFSTMAFHIVPQNELYVFIPTCDCFIYVLDSSNSSSITFWTFLHSWLSQLNWESQLGRGRKSPILLVCSILKF